MKTLNDILAVRPAKSVAEVLQMMTDMDAILHADDGLKWFNQLYLAVTNAVRESIGGTDFNDAPWLERLDIVFANLYFDAVGAALADVSSAPPAWRPLLAARNENGIQRIQFALAGMNAHINRDLPAALVQTFAADGNFPSRTDARHDDYERVNAILENVEGRVKKVFDVGLVGEIDAAAGRVDDVVAMWSIRAARDAAWTHAELLWALRHLPLLQKNFLATLDDFTGFAGRGLLIPVLT